MARLSPAATPIARARVLTVKASPGRVRTGKINLKALTGKVNLKALTGKINLKALTGRVSRKAPTVKLSRAMTLAAA